MTVLFAVGCGDDGDGGNTPDSGAQTDAPPQPDGSGVTHDLTFDGTGYAPHDGQRLDVKVVDTGDNSIVQEDTATVENGTFAFTWTGILEQGRSYEVRWYADANGNDMCNNPPEDHSWVSALSAVSSDQTVSHVHDTNVTPVCAIFGDHALTFTGSNFTPHNGQALRAAIVASDGSIVARAMTTVTAGAFSLSWPAPLVDGEAYNIHFFADVDSDSSCDPPPDDHVWNTSIGTASAAITYDYLHDTNVANVCATFPP